MYLRAIQGDSGKHKVDLALQDLKVIPESFVEHTFHVGSDLHFVTDSGPIARGKEGKQGRHTVFFAAVNPEHEHLDWPKDFDVTIPRIVPNKEISRVHQNAVFFGW